MLTLAAVTDEQAPPTCLEAGKDLGCDVWPWGQPGWPALATSSMDWPGNK